MITLTPQEMKIRKELINFVKIGDNNKSFVRYKPLAEKFGLPFENSDDRNYLYKLLGNISEYEHEHRRPLLSVMVVNDEFVPGKGFFILAKKLKKQRLEDDDLSFAVTERREVFDYWKNNDDHDA